MSTELHCPGCSKLIRAPDEAGGKRGKCPYCGRKVYIPMPESELETIPLAPVDPEDEARDARLRRESADYVATIDHVTERAGDSGAQRGQGTDSTGRSSGATYPPQAEDATPAVDVAEEVQRFLKAMRDSKLDTAEACVERLLRAADRSADYIQGLMASGSGLQVLAIKVENVPPPVLRGFLKTLLDRLR